jgi:tetraacyldisaccharide 4'-kinase
MRAPAFWNAPRPTLAARLLSPLGALYGAVAAARMRGEGARVGARIVCVGNFTLGGAGKTPAALALAEDLIARGERVAFLSRGYGGSLSGATPVEVDPARHSAREVGDEPLLLARRAPTVICADRLEGARMARRRGASVIVMDDGLQNPALAKDEAVAVVDGAVGLGNGLVFPAGPLRAAMAAQWPLVKRVLIVGPGAAGEAVAREAAARGKGVARARLVADPEAVAALTGRRLLAFAGIGRPEKFFETLRAAGLEVVATRAFPDHHPFLEDDLAALRGAAAARGLTLVTTEKDLARLDPSRREGIVALPARLIIEAGAEHGAG